MVRLVFFLFFSFLVALFAAFNSHEVAVSLIPGRYEMVLPVSALILLSMIFGIFLGRVCYAPASRALKRDLRRKEKMLKTLQKELASLRAAPATGRTLPSLPPHSI